MALNATDLFNDATTREIGGVGPDQVNLIVSDLIGVQQALSAAVPQINNLSDLHTQIIINQLNEEIATVENANAPAGTPILGTDLGQYAGRAINDIHRDIIDIAQADPGVQAVFNPTPLPALNSVPAPFHDDAAQTAFITQWIQDSNHLGQMAVAIENNGFAGDTAGLVQQIQTFANSANAFDQSQGGLWSARFWNEFRSDGTSGTAANALIDGLQTHNAGEVNAAAQQLAANSSDVAGNNRMADGGNYDAVVAAAQAPAAPDPAAPGPAPAPGPASPGGPLSATDLFNDATTREIGGVGPDQVNLIVSDLIGAQQALSAAFPQINNLSDLHAHVIINQLNEEIATVENANAPAGTSILGTDLGQYAGRAINDIHRDIIDIAQADPGVQAVFNPTPLPALNGAAAPFHDDAAQTAFITQWIQDSNHLGQMAVAIENNGFTGDIAALVQQIQTFANNANAFDQSQGGLWSARFWNEFRSDGTSGTAANALIDGLQTHNAGEVNAAAEQLAANSSDVAGNNLMADGGNYAAVVAAAQAPAATSDAAPANPTTPASPTTPAGSTTPADLTTPAANSSSSGSADPASAASANPAPPTPDVSATGHGGHGGAIANDIAALIHALQGGNSNTIDAAVSALGAAVNAHAANGTGTNTTGPSPSAGQQANNFAGESGALHADVPAFALGHHFEHTWI